MRLILTDTIVSIADAEMKCEASDIFWSLPKPIDYYGVRLSDMVLFFKSRAGKILKGQRYVKLLFVDSSDGEVMEMYALVEMNKFMFRMGLYPEIIQDAILDYRKRIRLKKLQTTNEK